VMGRPSLLKTLMLVHGDTVTHKTQGGFLFGIWYSGYKRG
jgi:hypothetical protein